MWKNIYFLRGWYIYSSPALEFLWYLYFSLNTKHTVIRYYVDESTHHEIGPTVNSYINAARM